MLGMITYKIHPLPNGFDSDDVVFYKNGKRAGGKAYRSKKRGTIGIISCPECGRENYMMNVSSGKCTWCGFDVNNITAEV